MVLENRQSPQTATDGSILKFNFSHPPKSEGRKKFPETTPVFEIARTRDARAGLPGSGETVESEHVFFLSVVGPVFKLGEDILPRPLQAPWSVPGAVTGVLGAAIPASRVKSADPYLSVITCEQIVGERNSPFLEVLLQGCLAPTLVNAGVANLGTNLITH